MKKTIIMLGAIAISILMVSTVTAVPNKNSETVTNLVDRIDNVKNQDIPTNIFDFIQRLIDFISNLIAFIYEIIDIVNSVINIINMIQAILTLIENIMEWINNFSNPPESFKMLS